APPPTDSPPPTETPVPAAPTDTPEPESPTDTPAPADTPAEVALLESSAEQPESPLVTPAPVRVIAPPPTLTPSATPSPTATFAPHPTPTASRRVRADAAPPAAGPSGLSGDLLRTIGAAACIGGLVLVLLGAVLGGAIWLYRLGWGNPADDDDDLEEVPVEIVE
ncbi:MAG: hypothetical protein AB1801_16470, partial [Chloroflexota bacterium]